MEGPNNDTLIHWCDLAGVRGARHTEELSLQQKQFTDSLIVTIEKYIERRSSEYIKNHNESIENLFNATQEAINNLDDESLINNVIDILEHMEPSAREHISEGTNPQEITVLPTGEMVLRHTLGKENDPLPLPQEIRAPATQFAALRRIHGRCVAGMSKKSGRARPKGKKSKDTLEFELVGIRLRRGRPKDISEKLFTGGIGHIYMKVTGKSPYRKHKTTSNYSPFVNLTGAILCWIYETKQLDPPEKWDFYNLNYDAQEDRAIKAADSMVKNLVEAIKKS